jgi:hypothetical protein
MASNIKDFNISKTFANVILTNVEDSDDLDGIPSVAIPAQRECNESLRDQGRLQDGLGNQIPLVLGKNLVEVEATPISAFSAIRRCDLMAVSAYQQIQSLIWS